MNMMGHYYMHLPPAGSDATPYMPGDGYGSALAKVATSATDVDAVVDATTITVNDATGLVVGQLLMTTDGFWGTISAINTLDVTVLKWNSISGRARSTPAVATGVINVFPAGSHLANLKSAVIHFMIPTSSVTGSSLNYILAYRMSTSTPVFPYESALTRLDPIPLDVEVQSPFALQVGTVANFNATLIYSAS